MRVFISWSGTNSHKVALALRDWLPDVIQAVKPFVSSEDLSKGSRWPKELGERLDEINLGIVCLTPDNLDSTWIHFEVGALSKQLEDSRVMTFLVGIDNPSVGWPLAQFQSTRYTSEDVRKLVSEINRLLPDKEASLDNERLEKAFVKSWPDLKARIDTILAEIEKPKPAADILVRSERSILEEILEIVREQQRSTNGLISMAALESLYEMTLQENRRVLEASQVSDRVRIQELIREWISTHSRLPTLADMMTETKISTWDEKRQSRARRVLEQELRGIKVEVMPETMTREFVIGPDVIFSSEDSTE